MIQCDGGIPGCQNCFRIGRVCQGYRHQVDLIFKNQYAGTIAIAHHLSGKPLPAEQGSDSPARYVASDPPLASPVCEYEFKPEPEVEEHNSEVHKHEQPDLKVLVQAHERLPPTAREPALTHDWNKSPEPTLTLARDIPEDALCYTLFQFDSSGARYQNYKLTFLPRLIQDAGPGSAVYQAMRACGTVNLANRSGPVNLDHKAALEYAQAIASVNTALRHPEEHLTDGTLIAVWLLQIREVGLPSLLYLHTGLTFLPSFLRKLQADLPLRF